MNKKLFTLLMIGAMLTSGGSVIAQGEPKAEPEESVIELEAEAAFVQINGTIVSVDDDTYSAKTEDGEDFFLNKNYLQLTIANSGDIVDISAGDTVTAYVREDTPMLLSLPAQYSPSVIVKQTEEMSLIDIDEYTKSGDASYVNKANSLAVNVSDETQILKLSREAFDGNLDKCDLIVVYATSTRSIPAQTTPEKIIVLNKSNTEEADFSGFKEVAVGDKIIPYEPVNGMENMLPVRAVAEALGFTVEWNDTLKAVLINGPYSFKIGEDSYVKGRMMPISLGQAPVCVTVGDVGVTYVPVSYFTEVLEVEAVYSNDVLTLNNKQ